MDLEPVGQGRAQGPGRARLEFFVDGLGQRLLEGVIGRDLPPRGIALDAFNEGRELGLQVEVRGRRVHVCQDAGQVVENAADIAAQIEFLVGMGKMVLLGQPANARLQLQATLFAVLDFVSSTDASPGVHTRLMASRSSYLRPRFFTCCQLPCIGRLPYMLWADVYHARSGRFVPTAAGATIMLDASYRPWPGFRRPGRNDVHGANRSTPHAPAAERR
ncbi:hypothetical protein [uncultured Thiodictyon sp.]|uniref:hypothetical protein n=1 Tax=uncultured Thiodictyon sp. TaxID=1846217 RepID=UPI0025FF2985|nr:hypothetical protein [uncultured Thiodictyon sp.]